MRFTIHFYFLSPRRLHAFTFAARLVIQTSRIQVFLLGEKRE